MSAKYIQIKGAREHNLKNISIEIPRNKLVVVTGLSGSGKSSLAFDTIYAEGQRRYLESLSAYARQFLEQMRKPDVDSIEGLSPAISIEQKNISKNPRSTVGTVTEVYDYLRLLYARVGIPYCSQCERPIESQTTQQMQEKILKAPPTSRFSVLSPIARGKKGEFQKELQLFRSLGYVRARIDGKDVDLSLPLKLQKTLKHDISIYIDRLVLKTGIESRLFEALEIATDLSDGLVEIDWVDKQQREIFSTQFACLTCGISFPEIEPRNFSFNSKFGACDACDGTGVKGYKEESSDEDIEEDNILSLFHLPEPCSDCLGARLKRTALHVKIGKKNIFELTQLPIDDTSEFLKNLLLTGNQKAIAEPILREIFSRLFFLKNVGLSYLSLSRGTATLSGGEAQRIRLASQIGSPMVGVLYILDEPSIGLHQRDNIKLIETLTQLKNQGNSVLVVEHDEETMLKADFIIDMGPGAGSHGGEILFAGPISELKNKENSRTSQYLFGGLEIPIPKNRRNIKESPKIEIKKINTHNLKNVSVQLPLHSLILVTGVSGSGKSSLVIDTLLPFLYAKLSNKKIKSFANVVVNGLEKLDKVIYVDQSPIGRTPRSNPATYTGVFTEIRALFAAIPEAKARGYTASRFSFNVNGGRCEACSGDGTLKVSMNFLPDVYVPCEVCQGKRYNRETLEIFYREKNIADVLSLTLEESLTFFEKIPAIRNKLKTLIEVGLGYLQLGQNSVTLSGGEAQRIKLSKELSKRGTGKTLYVLDEPTTGLHFDDVRKLIDILHLLADQGNTVIVIEHHLDVIKQGDYIIDLGPEGGGEGGEVLYQGPLEGLTKVKNSHTGRFLADILKKNKKVPPREIETTLS